MVITSTDQSPQLVYLTILAIIFSLYTVTSFVAFELPVDSCSMKVVNLTEGIKQSRKRILLNFSGRLGVDLKHNIPKQLLFSAAISSIKNDCFFTKHRNCTFNSAKNSN